MKNCCRPTKQRTGSARRRASKLVDAVGWLIPAVVLALTPKCPMCIAAYVALATGVGMSLSAAAAVRTTLFVLCAASLATMAARTISRVVAR
jgi:AhpD family alkylhydroperoxidase